MSPNQRPTLVLAPSISTTKVVTTTTTTTTYAPIPLPPLPPPSSPKDPKQFPLLHTTLPRSLRKFSLVFPGGTRATFSDGDDGDGEEEMVDERDASAGNGWRILKRENITEEESVVSLQEAVERFGRKRSLNSDVVMQSVEESVMNSPPPRKKPRASIPGSISINNAAPPSPLPSPTASPPPQSVWPSTPASGDSSPQSQAPLQPDVSVAALLSLPSLLSHFSALPPPLQSHILLSLLRHSSLPVLRTLHSVLTPTLARDFLTLLPRELVSHILSFLPYNTLARASCVSKSWREIIDSDPILWQKLMKSEKLWFGGHSENQFVRHVLAHRRKIDLSNVPLPLPHPFKLLFKSRHLTQTKWMTNQNPKRLTFPAHGPHVVTSLIFAHGRIISASDDNHIHVYSPFTGDLIRQLDGHQGGVWALAATKDTLVSGSTDRTVRIWDLKTGRCTHVFGGHTSTVRCLAIVKPVMIDVLGEDGIVRKERWPKRPLIVTGSRDNTLRVWTLPRRGEPEYRCFGADDNEGDPAEEIVDENPYHQLHLVGHDHAVRALAAHGRTLVSGSYDCSVRVWDIITGQQRWVLVGHSQKVYSVVLDHVRNQACSGAMDGTVRVWNLNTGQCMHVLTGHTSLVGLLGLSPSHLVSAAADSTLRVWDPDTGQLQHSLASHIGAITCFVHDEFKVLSGSDGGLKMWDIRDGSFVKDLLSNVNGVWQVVSEGRWCVAASNRVDTTIIDIWDFGRDASGRDLISETDWIGEPPYGDYDDSSDEDEDEDEEDDQADADAMDQDLEILPNEIEPEMTELVLTPDEEGGETEKQVSWQTPELHRTQAPPRRAPWAPLGVPSYISEDTSDISGPPPSIAGPSNIPRPPPINEDTPTRPRIAGRKRM